MVFVVQLKVLLCSVPSKGKKYVTAGFFKKLLYKLNPVC